MNIWPQLKHFKRSENWGDPKKVDHKLLFILDAYREELGIPLYVSRSVSYDREQSPHYPNEQGFSEAVDLFPLLSHNPDLTLCDCYLLATRYPFSGIGIYPYWRLTRRAAQGPLIEKGGIHLDISTRRPLGPYRAAGHWIGLPGIGGKKRYMGVSLWELKKHGLV